MGMWIGKFGETAGPLRQAFRTVLRGAVRPSQPPTTDEHGSIPGPATTCRRDAQRRAVSARPGTDRPAVETAVPVAKHRLGKKRRPRNATRAVSALIGAVRARARSTAVQWTLIARTRAEAGMSTAEYAVGTIAACAFAGLLFKIVTSGEVRSMLTALIQKALKLAG
ncbi:DUF4244 domain-containing protein [Microtetraspora malaysiensis]|uniref:DUF4244 domain-containing protein n=1 Tax=Microtetraspora malaysiensis TaxID=161358 RepID=UPI0034E28DC7